jgi:hypothetical protein
MKTPAMSTPDMSTLEFFDYLAASEATHDLGLQLADAWAEQELTLVESSAA